MNETKRKVPELRFPGFIEEWEEKKLGDLVEFYSGLTYHPDDVKENGTLVLRSSNIKNNRVVNANNVYVNSTKVNSDFVRKDDIIVVVRNGSRNLIGKHAKVKNNIENTVIGAFMTGIRSDYPNFINALLSTRRFYKEIYQNLGATINQITTGNFKKMLFKIPLSEEQQKIGDFFSKLDRQIELEEQKLELLEQQKKSYMQKIFSQELRFKDENGNDYPEWEKKNLYDVLNKVIDFRGRTPKKLGMVWSEKGYLALSALNVKSGYIDFDIEGKFGNSELYKKWMEGNELKKGQVVFTTEAPMGNVAQIPDNKGYILSQRTIAFEVNHNITNDFLALILRAESTYNQLLQLSSGATAKGVSQKSLRSLNIIIPSSIEEQKKISDIFNRIEKLERIQNKKIRLLKKRKKSMLQKMFV